MQEVNKLVKGLYVVNLCNELWLVEYDGKQRNWLFPLKKK
jgi:hypothetical protein